MSASFAAMSGGIGLCVGAFFGMLAGNVRIGAIIGSATGVPIFIYVLVISVKDAMEWCWRGKHRWARHVDEPGESCSICLKSR